jgi:hypothetical protein
MRFRMKPINEGPLEAFGYDPESAVLRLRFTTQTLDLYGVTRALYRQFQEACPKKDFIFDALLDHPDHPAKDVTAEDIRTETEPEPIVVNARLIEREPSQKTPFPWFRLFVYFWPLYVIGGLVAALLFVMSRNDEQPRRAGSVTADTPPPPAQQANPYLRSVAPAKAPPRSVPAAIESLIAENRAIEPLQTRTLPHGSNINAPIGMSGQGIVQVTNGFQDRAAHAVLSGPGVLRDVYMSAASSLTLESIPPCDCRMFVAFGEDWDGEHFTRKKKI